MTDPRAYYAQQSIISDPGRYTALYDPLPTDIAALAAVVQGLIIHYQMDAPLLNCTIPTERQAEIDTRYVDAILERIMALDDRPLTEPRPPEKRFVGCCRDFSLLCVSIARHKGLPARTRSGFAAYFDPGYYDDHVVVEYWNAAQERWILADTEMMPVHRQQFGIEFDVLDVPRDQFIVGAQAWQMYRRGESDPKRFGLGPGEQYNGWAFILNKFQQDLAALNKSEMLCWDDWGTVLSLDNLSDNDLSMLDRAAALAQGGDDTFDTLRAYYTQQTRLQVPSAIKSYSPVSGPVQVTLRSESDP